MLKNDIECDYSVNRERRVLKIPLWHFSAKRKENDTAMFIMTVDNIK